MQAILVVQDHRNIDLPSSGPPQPRKIRMRRRILVLCALALAGCVDDSVGPNARPQFDHTLPDGPTADIEVNNYTATFRDSGLETFYKNGAALFNGGLSYGNSATSALFVNLGFSYYDVAQTGLPVDIQEPGAGADHYSSTVMAEQPDQMF